MPLLEIRDLQVELGDSERGVRVVDGVSLTIDAGETLGLVGESGSGKTATALAIMRLLPEPPARYPQGQILLEGQDTLRLSPTRLRAVRGRSVGYVFQEPAVSLNPVRRIDAQILETLRLHRPEAATHAEVVRLLRQVRIADPESRARAYAHELSGGMQQRVMLAMAMASKPRLLVADEPTTALDPTVQAQILELLRELQQATGMAILLISHNLGVVAGLAQRLAVLYAGQIVEHGPTLDLLARPRHPYTRALLASVPSLEARRERLDAIPGSVPRPGAFPSGCRYHPRCYAARACCSQDAPEVLFPHPLHAVRCPWWETPIAPAVTPAGTRP